MVIPLAAWMPVSCLLFRRCPPAISRFVVAVFVWIAVYRCSGWRLPHVGEKVFEPMPSAANANALPSPVLKSSTGRRIATRQHHLPDAINASWLTPSFMAMNQSAIGVAHRFPPSIRFDVSSNAASVGSGIHPILCRIVNCSSRAPRQRCVCFLPCRAGWWQICDACKTVLLITRLRSSMSPPSRNGQLAHFSAITGQFLMFFGIAYFRIEFGFRHLLHENKRGVHESLLEVSNPVFI